MKTKHEILTALAHSGEEKILLASLLDKEKTCETRGYATSTRFLSMSERALCTEAVHQAGATGHALFWGGYEDAERGIYLFYPDYMDEESARLSAPLALLRAHKSRSDTLTHRDYLGALMGLQIDRSVVGDILVHDEGADIIVLEDVAEFILMNFGKAGRKNLSLTREELSDLRQAVTEEKRGTGSVASPRQHCLPHFRSAAKGRAGAHRKRTRVRQQRALPQAGAPDRRGRPHHGARTGAREGRELRRDQPEGQNIFGFCSEHVIWFEICKKPPVAKRLPLWYTGYNSNKPYPFRAWSADFQKRCL